MPEPGRAAPLAGCRVLVARPAAQAAALCRLIEGEGGRAYGLPLIEIVPVADPAGAAARLEAARGAALWIFSSRNAVEHAAALAPPPWPPVAAVGEATAAALEALGLREVLRPDHGDGAVALLAQPRLADVAGEAITLVSGERPLPELATQLAARGARVDSIAVYRRQPVAQAPARVADAVRGCDVAIVPSAEALCQLVAATPAEAQSALRALQLALPSPRVIETAQELGFRQTPLMPRRVSDAAYLDVLRRHWLGAAGQRGQDPQNDRQ